ncbi:MAG TPA: urate oxidase [Vicinamibacterales bacterium]|nr:urate oxidase [Vicinamibacterales bacterium]
MLVESAYGKSRVRLVQLTRRDDRHDLCDLTVAIRFQGQYEECYTAGDNAGVLPTDTMKNTVYALAAAGAVTQPETFGLALAKHFLARNPRLDHVRIDLTERRWARIPVGGQDDPHAFVGQGPDARTAQVTGSREETRLSAGITDLLVLKSSRSAFTGFVRDELTTLPDTDDRILATSLTATWRYRTTDVEFGPAWRLIRQTLLESFAGHDSASVQHTMYAIGEAVLERVADVVEIHLVMPNKHHLPVDLSRFGLENRNEIFVATDEPFGLIEATIAR